MRVLWLIRGLGPGGAEHLLVAQARAAGPDVTYEVVYQVAGKDHLVPALEAAGVRVRRVDSGPGWPLELRRLVRDHEIDVVHSHSPAMAAAARVALRLVPGGRRPRLVYTEHNRWDAYRLPTRLANAITFPLEHHVVAVSEEARSSVIGPLRARVETLHHGIDREELRDAAGDRGATRRSLGIDDATPVAVQVANFRREKAHEVMIDAAAVIAERGHGAKILMVGQGQLQEQTEELIRARGVGEVVTLLGYRDDIAAVLAAADMLALSSDHEGLPVAVMEALALGVPVVSTAVGGMPEAITDGVEGLLVPPRDPVALAEAIMRVADDRELRDRLAAGARARGADFDAAKATRRLEAIYAGD